MGVYDGFSYTERLIVKSSNGVILTTHDACKVVSRETASDAWVRYWMHWGGRAATLQRMNALDVDMTFVWLMKEYDYAERLSCFLRQRYRLSSNVFPGPVP